MIYRVQRRRREEWRTIWEGSHRSGAVHAFVRACHRMPDRAGAGLRILDPTNGLFDQVNHVTRARALRTYVDGNHAG